MLIINNKYIIIYVRHFDIACFLYFVLVLEFYNAKLYKL